MVLVQWNPETMMQLVKDAVREFRKRYPDDIVTEEAGGFVQGYIVGRGCPVDITDAVLVSLVASENA